MRILFTGVYALGAQALASLVRRNFEIVGVMTKPDEGPGQQPLLALAEQMRLPLLTPENLRSESLRQSIEKLNPQAIAVAGYHLKIPRWMLALPPLGVLNVHLSLLPRYRGPSPWKWAILRGEATTGVTVHMMTSRFDQGDILAQKEWPIDSEDTGESLFHQLSRLGAEALAEVLGQVQSGTCTRRAQEEALASYDPAPTDDDARIRWSRSAREIHNQIRGLHPRPGAWTTWDATRIRIVRSSLVGASGSEGPPGRIVQCDGAFAITTGDGILKVHEWRSDLQSGSSAPTRSAVSSNLLV